MAPNGGSAGVVLDHVTFGFNVTAMVLSSSAGTIGVNMKDSLVRASRSNGVLALAGSTINFVIDHSSLTNNVGAAVQSSGANSRVFIGNSTNTGLAASHLFQGNYYYGEQTSSVGVGLSYGRELERLPGGLLETNVRSIDVNGRHWFSKTLAVAYTLSLHRQGGLYTRRGVSVGLRYRF